MSIVVPVRPSISCQFNFRAQKRDETFEQRSGDVPFEHLRKRHRATRSSESAPSQSNPVAIETRTKLVALLPLLQNAWSAHAFYLDGSFDQKCFLCRGSGFSTRMRQCEAGVLPFAIPEGNKWPKLCVSAGQSQPAT